MPLSILEDAYHSGQKRGQGVEAEFLVTRAFTMTFSLWRASAGSFLAWDCNGIPGAATMALEIPYSI